MEIGKFAKKALQKNQPEDNKMDAREFEKKTFQKVVIGLIVLICAGLLAGGYYTVDQGDRAVILRFGKVVDVASPGLHFKIPLIDNVKKISVRTQKVTEKIDAYSRDIQAADLTISVNYSINPTSVTEIYTKYGVELEDRVIRPQILAKTKDVFGRNNAVEIVQSREAIAASIVKELQGRFEELGVIVQTVQIEDIVFSKDYERAVEERMNAEVQVKKTQQVLETKKLEAEMVRAKAAGDADARVAMANAEAASMKAVGDAEAHVIEVKGKALAQNPNLIGLIQAEKWNGELPTTFIPGASVPMLNIK